MMERKDYDMISKVELDKSYKVLELSPELLELIENGKEKLCLKAPNEEAEVVLCTSTKTFKMRQRNHSNTVMAMTHNLALKDGENDQLIGFTNLPSVYECHPADPTIDVSDIPIYDGMNEINESETILIDELKQRSAISDGEFDKVWYEMNGSSYNDRAIILDEEFVGKALHLLIMSITAAELDFEDLSIIEVYNSVKEEAPNFTVNIVETVLRRFAQNEEEPLRIDRAKVSKWYGVESLRRNCSRKPLSSAEFQIKWKSELPPFFECPIDMSLLVGKYVTPFPDKIQYISKASLMSDLNGRLKQLFKLQSNWDLDELIPFIDEFNTKNLKWESFIMKFAKKKKIGKRLIISQK